MRKSCFCKIGEIDISDCVTHLSIDILNHILIIEFTDKYKQCSSESEWEESFNKMIGSILKVQFAGKYKVTRADAEHFKLIGYEDN